jgi:MFS family permease
VAPRASREDAPVVDPAARSTFAALRVPNYARYWVALVFYVFGYRAEYVTVAWIVWEVTQSPLTLGYLGLAQGVPLIVFQLVGGVVADRADRLRVLLATQVLTAAAMTLAFAVTVSGVATVEVLFALTILSSIVRAFDEPTRMAMLPQLVDRDRLANAIALGSIPWQAGRMIGPSITGILIAAFGGAVGFAIAALASYVSLALYTRLTLRPEARVASGRHMAGDFAEGVAFVARDFVFATLIGLALANSVFGMSYLTVLPIFADWYFRSGSTGYGLLNAAHGIGAFFGTLAFATFAARVRRPGVVLLAGGATFGFALMAFSHAPLLWLAVAVLLVAGFSNTFYLTQISTIVQSKVPDALRGRVMSLLSLCWNLIPLGGLLAGALSAALDARFAVLLGGGVVATNAMVLLMSRTLRALR